MTTPLFAGLGLGFPVAAQVAAASTVNLLSGLGLVAFGLVLAWQTAATSSP